MHCTLTGYKSPPSQLPNGGSKQWRVPDTVSLPGAVRVIALKVTNESPWHGGVLASDGLGSVLTNSSWKCLQDSFVSSNQWMMPSYSDSAWPSAISNAGNIPSSLPWGNIPGIDANAQWIWTTSMPSSQLTIYCRLRVQKVLKSAHARRRGLKMNVAAVESKKHLGRHVAAFDPDFEKELIEYVKSVEESRLFE